MNKKKMFPLFGWFVSLVFITLACSLAIPGKTEDSGVDIVEVKTADGSAVLEIPLDALPASTQLEDISIELLSSSTGDNIEDVRWIYELSPDGLSFSQPVKLMFSFDSDDELPVFSAGLTQISKEEEAEPLEFSEAEILDDGTINLTTEISHFSKIVLDSFFFEVIHFGYPGQPIPVGKVFDVDIVLFRKGPVVDWHRENNTWRHVMDGNWQISGDWFAGSNFSPQSQLNKSHYPGNVDELALTTTWICTRPSQIDGNGEMIPESIYYKGIIEYYYKLAFLDGELNEDFRSHRDVRKEVILARATPFYCIEESPEDDIQPETPADTIEAVPQATEELPPTSEPEPTVFDDEIDDPVCCIQCQKTEGDIPDNIDIDTVEYKLLKEWGENKICVHKFTIRTVKPLGDSIGEASISIDDPSLPQAVDNAPHCLEAGVNRTYSVILGGGAVSSSQDGMVLNEDGKTYSWKSQDINFMFEVDGNAIHFYIPCNQLTTETTWMAWTTDVAFCDEVGYR